MMRMHPEFFQGAAGDPRPARRKRPDAKGRTLTDEPV